MKPYIRWMISRDMNEVSAIELSSFEHPWSEDEFRQALRSRNCIGMVAVDQTTDAVVGFMIYELSKTSLKILNFAVDPKHRLKGVGRKMLDKLTGKLSSQRRSRVTADVRERNLDAHLFFKACGFRATGIVRDCFDDPVEDAYHFVYKHGVAVKQVAVAAGEAH